VAKTTKFRSFQLVAVHTNTKKLWISIPLSLRVLIFLTIRFFVASEMDQLLKLTIKVNKRIFYLLIMKVKLGVSSYSRTQQR